MKSHVAYESLCESSHGTISELEGARGILEIVLTHLSIYGDKDYNG